MTLDTRLQRTTAMAIVSGGSNGYVGWELLDEDTGLVARIDAVDGAGAATAVSIVIPGAASGLPPNPVSFKMPDISGVSSGSPLTANLTWSGTAANVLSVSALRRFPAGRPGADDGERFGRHGRVRAWPGGVPHDGSGVADNSEPGRGRPLHPVFLRGAMDTVTKDPEAERTPREKSALAAAQAAALEVEVLRDMLSEGRSVRSYCGWRCCARGPETEAAPDDRVT